MSRPEYPRGIVLPSSCIHRIRSEQNFYDRNPEYCERMQQQREEEEERLAKQEREYEEWQNKIQKDDEMPF